MEISRSEAIQRASEVLSKAPVSSSAFEATHVALAWLAIAAEIRLGADMPAEAPPPEAASELELGVRAVTMRAFDANSAIPSDVYAVRDVDGDIWRRYDSADAWHTTALANTRNGHPYTWKLLTKNYGPVLDLGDG